MNVKCPKCSSTQITAQKKGFGFGKALAGIFVAGPLGLLAGGIGKNNIEITCLNCGNKWKPTPGNSKTEINRDFIPKETKQLAKPIDVNELEVSRKKEIYERTGLSSSDPKFAKLGKSKRRR